MRVVSSVELCPVASLIQTATPMAVVGLGGVDAGEPDTCK